MQLYSYFRSSAAFRVRIALNLKGLAYECIPVHLVRDGGEQHAPAYQAINPSELVPTLIDANQPIAQSLAIIEYLEETHPHPSLLPGDAMQRAQIRAFAQSIACDIHPLNNLRVLNYLKDELHVDDAAKSNWYTYWIGVGLAALEQQLAKHDSQDFCFGTQATLADCCLIPQVYNALRFDCDMSQLPRINRIYKHCMGLDAFIDAAPEHQPDAP